MRLIKPSYKICEQSYGLQGIYEQIERAGRVCYKSEDKITKDSAKPFVDRMITSQHYSVLEHGTVYLKVPYEEAYRVWDNWIHENYSTNSYSIVNLNSGDFFVTTNYRVLVENGWLDDLKYLCEPTEFHEKRVTVHFICDRGISHEYVRHRVFSFSQESTRYCNYLKNKFNNEIIFIIPCWLNIPEGNYTYWDGDWCDTNKMKIQLEGDNNDTISNFLWSLQNAELQYHLLINRGWKPQQARAVLSNSLKTELVMTGFVSDWEYFFELRCSTNAHPQARELAIPLREEFINRKYIVK